VIADATVPGRTVRYWPRDPLTWLAGSTMAVLLVTGIALVSVGVGVGVTGSVTRHRPFFIISLALGVPMIALAVWFLKMLLRPALVLAGGTLRLPRGAFRTLCIPVGDVTGVGLLCTRPVPGASTRGAPPGWYMSVWHGAGRADRVGISYVPFALRAAGPRAARKFLAITPESPAGSAPGRFHVRDFDAAAGTDQVKLAATHAGRVARDVYQHVLAQQGPTGPLAVTGQQKHVQASGIWAPKQVLAFWSPDGVIGRPTISSGRPAS
jgi:hypothetical protein